MLGCYFDVVVPGLGDRADVLHLPVAVTDGGVRVSVACAVDNAGVFV